MEIRKTCYAPLSNWEVMTLLQDMKEKDKDKKKKNNYLKNLATITYETLRYLEEQPCKNQTRDGIKAFNKAMEALNLRNVQKVMMVNDPPTTPLEIQLILENNILTDDQINDLIVVAQTHLIGEQNETEDE